MPDYSDMIKQGIQSSDVDMERLYMKEELQTGQEETTKQIESRDALKNVFEETTNPLAARFQTRQKSAVDQKSKIKKTEQDRIEKRIIGVDDMKDNAEKFQQRNPELKSQILLLLIDRIKDATSKEEILNILKQFYPDASTADDALKFLLACTTGDLKKIVEEAIEEHQKLFGREIAAGNNIAEEVQKYVKQGVGMPTTLRDLYRDITGTPREPVALFSELSDRYNYKDLRKVLAFLFHSMGADLKSQGPSIPPGLLHRLLSEVRSLQAILGIYQFFRMRMKLISFLFQRDGLTVPPTLTFELLAKQFVNLLQERYPSGDKVLQSAGKLGIEKWILAKIIVFSQLRDAIREVALGQLYRNVQHRDDLYNAIIEALEALEEELDELLERDKEEDSGEQKDKKKNDDKEEKDKDTIT